MGRQSDRLLGGHGHHLVARRLRVELRRVVAQALDEVVGRLEVRVRNEQQVHFEARLDLEDLAALLVEEIRRHVDGNLGMDRGGVLLHRLFLQDAQHVQRRGRGIADVARAMAARAGRVRRLLERGLQPLARELEQAEARDLADLHARAVVLERVAKPVLDLALVLRALHVDEVDHDEAAQVAKPQLASDFVGRLHVRVERGLLDVVAAGGAGAVDVDRHERLGVVDHDGAAGRKRHVAAIGALDLVLDLEAREERDVVAVELHLVDVRRHHRAHERQRLVEDRLGVDEDLADVGLKEVADRAHHQARLEIDEAGALLLLGGFLDRAPELQQVVQVPLHFLQRAADARGARDEAHAVGHLQLVHHLAQFITVFAFYPS